jgi:hypothetical protein
VAVASPYTLDEKSGLREPPPHSATSTPNFDGIQKEYVEPPPSSANVGGKSVLVRKHNNHRWRKSWNKAIDDRFWPRILYGVLFLAVITVWLTAM